MLQALECHVTKMMRNDSTMFVTSFLLIMLPCIHISGHPRAEHCFYRAKHTTRRDETKHHATHVMSHELAAHTRGMSRQYVMGVGIRCFSIPTDNAGHVFASPCARNPTCPHTCHPAPRAAPQVTLSPFCFRAALPIRTQKLAALHRTPAAPGHRFLTPACTGGFPIFPTPSEPKACPGPPRKPCHHKT